MNGKNIFTTIEYVAQKILEAITGHNSQVDAHPTLTQQINVLPNKIRKLNNEDNWNKGNTTPSDYLNTMKPNGARGYNDLGISIDNGYWCNVFGINNYNADTGVTEFAATDKGKIFYRTQVGVANANSWAGSSWQQVATTTKTEILCTPQAGYKIVDNKSHQVNNQIYISFDICKTDETVFAINTTMPICTPSINALKDISLSVSYFDSAGEVRGLVGSGGTAILYKPSGMIYINIQQSNVKRIVVSGTYIV